MKYRAILNDPGNLAAERPVQILSNSRDDVDDWITRKLEAAISDDSWVDVYQNIETRIAVVRKPKKEPKP